MKFIKYLILALVQGITEILPVSSSGHLLIFEEILSMNNNDQEGFLALALFLHFGSLIAIIIYYWKELIVMLKGTIKYLFLKNKSDEDRENSKLFLWLIIATIPAGIVGLLFSSYIDTIFSSLWFVFSFLIITGIILFLIKNINSKRTIKEMNWKDALFIGIFQAIGVLPGISRSGITIVGCKVRKIDDSSSAHFSFLLFLPVTLGSSIIELFRVLKKEIVLSDPFYYYLIGIIVSATTTFLGIKFLFNFIKKGKLYYFSIYCILVGLIGIIIKTILIGIK